MKKVLKVFGIIISIVLAILLILFLSNLIRNIYIINNVYSAKEKFAEYTNYQIEKNWYENEERQKVIVYNKGDKQRIDVYSWHPMSIYEKSRIESSKVVTEESEKSKYIDEIFIDETKFDKNILIKQYLFRKIYKNDDDEYIFNYDEKIENTTDVHVYSFIISKDNFLIKDFFDAGIEKKDYRKGLYSLDEKYSYNVEFNTVTDEKINEVVTYEN